MPFLPKITQPSSRYTLAFQALFIAGVLITVAWVIVTAWGKINGSLQSQQLNDINITHAYLLDSDAQTPVQIDLETFIEGPLNSAPIYYGKLNHWFRLDTTNQGLSDSELVWILDSPMNDHLSVYQLTQKGFVKISHLGDQQANISLKQRIMPHFKFTVAANSSHTFLIHSKNQSAPFLPFVLLEENTFKQYEKDLHLIWGTFIGIVLLMSAYNLVLFAGVKDSAYLLYIGYIISLLLLLGSVHGFGYYLFPTPVQLWLSDNIISLNALAGYFALQFAIHFLRFDHSDGPFFKFAYLCSYAMLALAFVFYLLPEYLAAQLFAVAQALLYLLIARLIFVKMKTRFRWAKYYLFSWIPFFIGAAIGFLLFSGYVEYNFFTRHALMFSVIFEMAFISMALADRLGETERNRLFQASHDFKLGFANENLLEIAIEQEATNNANTELTLVTVEIANYDAVIPYIHDRLLERLILKLAEQFEFKIQKTSALLRIDPMSEEHQNIAMVRGEMLAFCVKTNNKIQLANLLTELSNQDNFNPMPEEVPYRIHCVFGAAIWSAHNLDPAALINQAKRAINHATQENQAFCIYSADNNPEIERKIRLAQDLGQAIANSDLALYHQPQLLLDQLSAHSSEVLVRWHHPELGAISPVEFVRIAEETGLIKNLTRWVMNEAFVQAAILKGQFQEDFNVSINISALDLSRHEFIDEVLEMLSAHQLSAQYFTLEVTETVSLTDTKTFTENFARLKKAGFKFAIDDFGTGYSSLEYANNHPFSELKIDRSFVTELLNSEKLMTIVSATISMAKELKFHITAEGIEDKKTLLTLKALGCEKLQGFYIAKPMPFADYQVWRYDATNNKSA